MEAPNPTDSDLDVKGICESDAGVSHLEEERTIEDDD